MLRTIAFALALSLAPAVAAARDDAAAALKAFTDKYHDSIVASGELLYWVGYCEPYLPDETVTFYLDEYVSAGTGKADDFVNATLNKIHIDQYLEGRRARAKAPMDGAKCKKMVEGAAADLEAAQKRASAQ
ncbi:MAG: hypothetical protein ACOY4K_06325 [Pseudomonadota bacterium]